MDFCKVVSLQYRWLTSFCRSVYHSCRFQLLKWLAWRISFKGGSCLSFSARAVVGQSQKLEDWQHRMHLDSQLLFQRICPHQRPYPEAVFESFGCLSQLVSHRRSIHLKWRIPLRLGCLQGLPPAPSLTVSGLCHLFKGSNHFLELPESSQWFP